jgi:polyvinyl alcohol dehydrogenase (cytochrome)
MLRFDLSTVCRVATGSLLALGAILSGNVVHAQTVPPPWSFAGADLSDTHGMLSTSANISSPTQINPRTASKLALLWSYATKGNVSATPTVEEGGLYVPDWAGMLYKLNPATGALIWSNNLTTYTGLYSVSRTSPAIGTNVIVIGDDQSHAGATPGARVIGVNKTTGALAWVTIVDPNPDAYVTASPVIYDNMVFVGTVSTEEETANQSGTYAPTFRGSMTALNVNTGAVVWKFYTVPTGYSGAGTMGSNPVVWLTDHYLIFGTGDNYKLPTAVEPCVQAAGTNKAAQLACLPPTNYADSLIALDVFNGTLVWSRQMDGVDAWNFACNAGAAEPGNCPDPEGPDADFASAPNLIWNPTFTGVSDDRGGTSANYILGAGEKSSTYWALNPANGGLFWSTFIGKGGIQWGAATDLDDHNMVFVALNNASHEANTLAGRGGVPVTWSGGAWGALNIVTGATVWQIPSYGQDLTTPANDSSAQGGVSFTNRVVFAGSSSGYFVALDANSGLTYWKFNSGNVVGGTPAIFNETLYWGTGYKASTGANMVYAFSIP